MPNEEQNLNWLIIRVVSLTLDHSIASSVNNWQSVLNSTRFEFESGDSTNGTRMSLFEIFKMSITFLSSFASLNMNDAFSAIFAILNECANLFSDVVNCCDILQENSACRGPSLIFRTTQLRDKFLSEMFVAFCVLVHVLRISHK